MRLRLKTSWQKFVVCVYISSLFFSLVALTLTVAALARWSFIYEQFAPTRWIFSTFGLSWGAMMMGLWSFGITFGPLILIWELLEHLENGEFAVRLVRYLGWAFVEAFGLQIFVMFFLDMTNDLFVVYEILSGRVGHAPLTPSIIISLTIPLFLVAFVLSFFTRTIRHLRIKRLNACIYEET